MRKTLLVTALLELFSAVPSAQAASTASATLDWSKFNASVLEGKGSFAFDNGGYASAAIYDNGWKREAS